MRFIREPNEIEILKVRHSSLRSSAQDIVEFVIKTL